MAIKLTITETRWHGCRYTAVEPFFDDYDLMVNQNSWTVVRTWCYENFGKPGDVWKPVSARWYENGGRYYFRRSADLTAFMLRWA